MWGPGPFYTDYEPLTGAPEGNHLVQYFDKGRLEINEPRGDQSSPRSNTAIFFFFFFNFKVTCFV